MRSTDRDTGKVIVFALIAMVSYKPRNPDGYTLGWKEMSEASLPYLFNCPERILNSSIRATMRTPPNGAKDAASIVR